MLNELDALLEMHKEPVASNLKHGLDNNVQEMPDGLDEFNKSEVVIDSELGADEQPQDTFHELEEE